jgi:PAS domain S-box-containing protein
VVTRDLTERRRAEEMLRRSEERFRLLVQSVRDYAIFMLDPDGRIVNWNEGAERIKGYRADEIVGQHFSAFYPEDARKADWPQHELKVAAAEGRFEDEGWRLRKDGSRFWANVVITALRAPSGQLLGFAKVTRDLTERRAAELAALESARRLAHNEGERIAAEQRARELADLAEQLRQRSEELKQRTREAEAANRAKANFLAAMSHELRTPLNAIGGYAELLEMELRGPLTAAQRQDVERIRLSQQHLLGIINDILSFSRIEAGQIRYDMDDIPLQGMIDTVAAMIAPQAHSKAISFKHSPCPAGALVRADGRKAEQILVNLLSNAVKFTEPGGSVSLDCSMNGDRVQVHVRDTGSGIPPDQHEAIFEPFVQVGRDLTSRAEGTGLGLAISRDLARGMGGDVTVESEEGRGSVFTLVLRRVGAG